MNGATPFKISSETGVQGGLEGYNIFNPGLRRHLHGRHRAPTCPRRATGSRRARPARSSRITSTRRRTSSPAGRCSASSTASSPAPISSATRATEPIGPKPAPLGLAAEPGGLPLYKNGAVVGGIGVMATGLYSLDLDILDVDTNLNEVIAVAGSRGFDAPTDRRADHITADGRTLRYTDNPGTASNPATAPGVRRRSTAPSAACSRSTAITRGTAILAGVEFGTPASGIRADTNPAFAGLDAFMLVDQANVNRYPPRAGTDGLLTAGRRHADPQERDRGRESRPRADPAAARQPGAGDDHRRRHAGRGAGPDPHPGRAGVRHRRRAAEGADGDVLLQPRCRRRCSIRCRPPSTRSSRTVSDRLLRRRDAPVPRRSRRRSPTASRTAIAAVGNLARPFFPDGITGTAQRPVVGAQRRTGASSTSACSSTWSPTPSSRRCWAAPSRRPAPARPRIANGIQIFPGSVPIYRGTLLVGAIGVSGDGIDQDDMVAFLGPRQRRQALNNGIANAPATDPRRQHRAAGRGDAPALRELPASPVQRQHRPECLCRHLSRAGAGGPATLLAAGPLLAWCGGAAAQAPARAGGGRSRSADGRQVIQVLVEDLGVHLEPAARLAGVRAAAAGHAGRGRCAARRVVPGRRWPTGARAGSSYVAGKADPGFLGRPRRRASCSTFRARARPSRRRRRKSWPPARPRGPPRRTIPSCASARWATRSSR